MDGQLEWMAWSKGRYCGAEAEARKRQRTDANAFLEPRPRLLVFGPDFWPC